MTNNKGVPASPSGHSRAEPEEVSVVPTSVPNAVERVARAIAANKRKLLPDSPEIDRVWNGYCGQARAAIAAMAALREDELAEYERLGLLWRNPAPNAAAPNVPIRNFKCWVDAAGRSGFVK